MRPVINEVIEANHLSFGNPRQFQSYVFSPAVWEKAVALHTFFVYLSLVNNIIVFDPFHNFKFAFKSHEDILWLVPLWVHYLIYLAVLQDEAGQESAFKRCFGEVLQVMDLMEELHLFVLLLLLAPGEHPLIIILAQDSHVDIGEALDRGSPRLVVDKSELAETGTSYQPWNFYEPFVVFLEVIDLLEVLNLDRA